MPSPPVPKVVGSSVQLSVVVSFPDSSSAEAASASLAEVTASSTVALGSALGVTVEHFSAPTVYYLLPPSSPPAASGLFGLPQDLILPVGAGAGAVALIALATMAWKCCRRPKSDQHTEHVRFNVTSAPFSSADYVGPSLHGGKSPGSLDKITLTDAPKSDWNRFSQTSNFATARI